ncbi:MULTISPECIES: SDR family oxidoreductase [unclassified Undibacterium]|uniref:SDR family NAD(P)-dependent oxidoreductase n=1 Tax=unclassified Undibacterium TaxID=2630295 RepID=UPI002AC94380|nr:MULTISPECIES: SDR family oxidoreductase [unclassified Undibacterium]MEB0140491.1 SDR family oxidoreductase [Undibacterium sp. CCC2.1]MEB0174160.1 SDR family oxidoreductase [Undibacterium sp. CCC1.1]MEB0178095.1 SDR family oxidoreductase [Undibacterium sp. CCC3.4]MEB0217310.1 SDR family oxidoreductase [Undibacterium sp. 5I2]WPX44621.1 SDR family oxidoreductase [Undibacterium sp. CCC3.4]
MKKIVVVTGGNSGIGEACAFRFALEDYHVVICARRENLNREVVQRVRAAGGSAEQFMVDLRDATAIAKLFDAITMRHSRIDSLVNCAGIEGTPFVSFEAYPDEVFDDVMAINVKAPWLCMKRVLPLMREQRSGTIVNVASLAGLRASVTGGVGYTASKHALVGVTKSAAREYAVHQVRVNAVCPAFVRTPMAQSVVGCDIDQYGPSHPINRVCEKNEVADVVYWLCSDQSSFVTGVAIPVDGGVLA